VGASHEAWDGSGYPHGLTRDAIPVGARIVAIVDTFDALTWGRGDDDPVVCARAAAELVRCAGSQFDPDLVRAWLRVAEAGNPWTAGQRADGAAPVQAAP
jgi:response regulator RpfG family c-di-GMP phosphodiesterase